MTKQARSELTRAAIIRAAAEMFDRYGYGMTSLNDIVAHGGVTKGALYFHFASKEQLALAVLDEHLALLAETVRIARRDRPALDALIRCSFDVACQLADPVVSAGVHLTMESSGFQRPSPDPFRHWVDTCAELLAAAVDEQDVVPQPDVEATARYLVGSFMGVRTVARALDGGADLAARVAELWTFTLPGLMPAGRVGRHLDLVTALADDARRR
jgi:AcrR family transcriptional regulator